MLRTVLLATPRLLEGRPVEDVKRLGGSAAFSVGRLVSENPVLSAASQPPSEGHILPTGDLGLVWASDIVVVAHYS